ncbi:calsequestrin-1-like [Ostrea edulis]|uniref:calsequestrin-1-like n=1 Tax=Ostrea edulis TaxID=37623 RepID=UPI002095E38C|nr:calsequestrin-1-like [Ostrea edulis]
MFASTYDLQRHTKNGCPVEEEENYAMSEVGFTPLVNQVLEENQSQFDKKLDQLMEENSKLTRREAREEVKDSMLPKDRALLLRKYKRILILTSNLNKSKLHRGIREEVSTLMENTDIDVEKAISRVFNQHKQDFDELLEIEDNTDDEESDEEEESDNDDDDDDDEEESDN